MKSSSQTSAAVLLFVLVQLICPCFVKAQTNQPLQANEPLMVFAGDGLRVVVLRSEGDGEVVSGELHLGADVYPFSGKFEVIDNAEQFTGQFQVKDKSFPLRGKQSMTDGVLTLETGGKTYRLAPIDSDDAGADKRADEGNDNPLGKANGAQQAKPVPVAPNAPNLPDAADKKPVNKNIAQNAAGLPGQLRLKLNPIPDINMGNVAAATILVPEGWEFEGRIEWRGTQNPFPQRAINMRSKEGDSIEFPFFAQFQYLEANGQAQGVPPPQDVKRWIADLISQRQGVTNVRVVTADRDPRGEKNFVDLITRTGGNFNGNIESWVIRASFDANGQNMTEEVSVMVNASPPIQTPQMLSIIWSANFDVAWRAPTARFDAMRPIFQMIFWSLRPDPRWHTQTMEIRTMMMRQQTQNLIEELKGRAQQYNKRLSEQQMTEARQKNASDDEAHRLRINAIAETHDYVDKDGTRVNVPIHYKSIFGDGTGNYVLTNNADQPGGSFVELKPWK